MCSIRAARASSIVRGLGKRKIIQPPIRAVHFARPVDGSVPMHREPHRGLQTLGMSGKTGGLAKRSGQQLSINYNLVEIAVSNCIRWWVRNRSTHGKRSIITALFAKLHSPMRSLITLIHQLCGTWSPEYDAANRVESNWTGVHALAEFNTSSKFMAAKR